MRRKHQNAGVGWASGVSAVDVGRLLRIVPYWLQRTPRGERKELVIDPGPSFGAGNHPTTVMALELLEEALESLRCEAPSPSLLDVGTGTGVQAIAGKALGAGFTVAFDPDGAAVFSARRNFGLNGLWKRGSKEDDGPCVFIGGIEAVGGRFDLVMANLVAPVLLRVVGPLTQRVKHRLILAGIADPMAEKTISAYCAEGLSMVKQLSREGWNAGLFVRRPEEG